MGTIDLGPDEKENEHIEDFVLRSVQQKSTHGCWLVRRDCLTMTAYRQTTSTIKCAYTLFKGVVEDGCRVGHVCGNPRCINPVHMVSLAIGIQLDIERIVERMARKRKSNVGGGYRRGEQNPNSKLTLDQVNNIKRMLMEGKDQRLIASRFKLSLATVSHISTGKLWSDDGRPIVFSLADAASELHVSQQTVRQWVGNELLAYIPNNTRHLMRFTRTEIDRFKETRK